MVLKERGAGTPATISTRRRRSLRFAVIIAAVLAVAAIAAFQLLSARRHLATGAGDIQNARSSLSAQSLFTSSQSPSAAVVREDLAAAEREFGDAQSDLFLWQPILSHLGWVPHYGGQLAAAPPAASAAYHSTRSAEELLGGLVGVHKALDVGGGKPLSQRLAAGIEANASTFANANSDAAVASASLASLPLHTGSTQLDNAIHTLRGDLPLLRTATRWLADAPTILGIGRPSRYLVELQNPAEIHATGGFLGAIDVATLRRGVLRQHFSSSQLRHEVASVDPPLPYSVYTPEAHWLLRTSNWSPNFPTTAQAGAWLYRLDTGTQVDGVVGVVDTAASLFLSATGPVYLPEYHRWVNARTVGPLAQKYVHQAYHGPLARGLFDTLRKQFLDYVILAVVRRIDTLPQSKFPALAHAMATAIQRRDIMLFDYRSGVEAAIVEAHADGSLTWKPGDYLGVVDENLSYSKLNPYVTEHAAYRVNVLANGSADATLRLTYHDRHSPADIEGRGPMFGALGTRHDYEDFVRVYVPPGSQLISSRGLQKWAPQAAYGLTQFAGQFIVREFHRHVVTLRYRIPTAAILAAGGSSYQLTIRHQPGSGLQSVAVTIGGDVRMHLARRVPIGQDALVSVPFASQMTPLAKPVTAVNPRSDPYIDPRYLSQSKRFVTSRK